MGEGRFNLRAMPQLPPMSWAASIPSLYLALARIIRVFWVKYLPWWLGLRIGGHKVRNTWVKGGFPVTGELLPVHPPVKPAQSCLPCMPLAGRVKPLEAIWTGLKMKVNRTPDPPQDMCNTSYRFSGGKCPHQPADSWPSGDSRGLREPCRTVAF